MEELTAIFEAATAGIDSRYFHVNIAGGDPVYRERVYCYELYHQMRMRWPPSCPFWLNGELDKVSHPILTELGVAAAKPDFLVHIPGEMGGNHAMIEVKSQGASKASIIGDLEKLSLFRKSVGYERAMYLIYGYDWEPTLDRIQAAIKSAQFAPIEVWVHQAPNTAAIRAN